MTRWTRRKDVPLYLKVKDTDGKVGQEEGCASLPEGQGHRWQGGPVGSSPALHSPQLELELRIFLRPSIDDLFFKII